MSKLQVIPSSLREQILASAQSNFDEGDYITDAQDWRRFLDDCMSLVTTYIEATKQERIERNKSFCGCPMCEHHSAPYKSQAQKAVLKGRKT